MQERLHMSISFLDTVLIAPQFVVLSALSILALQIKRPVRFSVITIVGQTTLYALTRHILPMPTWVSALILFAFFLCVLCTHAQDRLSVPISFHLIHFLLMFFCEFLCVIISYLVLDEEVLYSKETAMRNVLFMKPLYLCVYLCFCIVFLVLWRKIRRIHTAASRSLSFIVIPFLFSQIGYIFVLIYISMNERYIDPQAVGISVLAGVLFILSNVVLYIVVYRTLQRQKTELRREHLLQSMESQFSMFQQLFRHEEEHHKIQHDLNNQLQTAYALFSSGATDEAALHIQRLTQLVASRKRQIFCANPTLNALLSLKDSVCRGAEIELDVDISLQSDFSMNELELCSLFGNLLDNAFNACEHHPEDATPVIVLRVAQKAGFLVISCENPIFAPTQRDETRRHWGLQIIEDIAQLHDGSVVIEQKDDAFTIQISLELEHS